MTALEISKGTLIVFRDGATLFVDGRYEEICRQQAPVEVASDKSFGAWFKDHASITTIGFDPTETTYARFLELQHMLVKLAVEGAPAHLLRPCSSGSKSTLSPVKALRLIKDQAEIKLLKEAADLGSEGFDYALSLLKEGVTELFVASQLEIYWKNKGAKGVSFEPIIAFGVNTSKPHHRASDAVLKKGDLVMIDIGVNRRHYMSDMTRTIAFGECQAILNEIHAIVLEAQLAAIAKCRPGVPIGALDSTARDIITKHGYGERFSHSLGHGVGLEIHEAPVVRKDVNSSCLEEGMIITIEPGIYIPNVGGVRIEDTVVITAEGYENLTNRSKEIGL